MPPNTRMLLRVVFDLKLLNNPPACCFLINVNYLLS